MSSLFHDDGCVRGNIKKRRYRVTFAPKCGHTRFKTAVLTVEATSRQDARRLAEMVVRIPQMVFCGVTEIGERTGSGTAGSGVA